MEKGLYKSYQKEGGGRRVNGEGRVEGTCVKICKRKRELKKGRGEGRTGKGC